MAELYYRLERVKRRLSRLMPNAINDYHCDLFIKIKKASITRKLNAISFGIQKFSSMFDWFSDNEYAIKIETNKLFPSNNLLSQCTFCSFG